MSSQNLRSFFSPLQAIVYASNLTSVFVCVVHACLTASGAAETGLKLKSFLIPTAIQARWKFEGLSCDSMGGKRRTSCESLYIFIYTTRRGERTVEKIRQNVQRNLFFFVGSSHRQVEGLHVHLSVRDGHKVRAWCIYLQKLMEILLLFVCIPTNLYTFTVLYM